MIKGVLQLCLWVTRGLAGVDIHQPDTSNRCHRGSTPNPARPSAPNGPGPYPARPGDP